MNISGVHQFVAKRKGPTVVVFGGTHGDEISGINAVRRLRNDFSTQRLELSRGTLYVVEANEAAIALGKRYVEHNLNRLYRDTYESSIDTSSYEFKRAQELKPLLERCEYFLDLHSAPIAQDPFFVCDEKYAQFFLTLGEYKIIVGWNTFASATIAGDSDSYADKHGAIAATFEAGSHQDPRAAEIAYDTSIKLLVKAGLIEDKNKTAHAVEQKKTGAIYEMYRVITKDAQDFSYAIEPKNFIFIGKGEVFAQQNKISLVAEEDSVLLIPMKPEDTKVGEEVCYLGRKVHIKNQSGKREAS